MIPAMSSFFSISTLINLFDYYNIVSWLLYLLNNSINSYSYFTSGYFDARASIIGANVN